MIILGDNMSVLPKIESGTVNLIYIDPPFNTGKDREYTRVKNKKSGIIKLSTIEFKDSFNDYISFLAQRLNEAYRILTDDGSIFVHLDYREVHYCKVLMDSIFGRKCFMNEIIWSYDFGGRSTKRWSPKHDNILWYVKNPRKYTYNYDAIDRIPYISKSWVSEEKFEKGKTPTDVWWHTIVHTLGKERTGYPTQKPIAIVERIVKVHSNEGDLLMDFFAGSGTLGEAAAKNNRDYILIDNNAKAVEIMKDRLCKIDENCIISSSF